MSSDEIYIKMILALPDDFFEGWEWNHCDYALNLDNVEMGIVTPLEEQFHTEFKILYVDSVFKDTEWVFKERLRPVPSQEQLQNLIKKYWLKSDDTVKDYDIIKFFSDWFEAHWVTNYKEIENESGNSVWLRYLMYAVYDKSWDGENWVNYKECV